MLALEAGARIFLYKDPVSMRNGFEGLSAIVEIVFETKVISGSYFAFINNRKDRMKVIYWDGDGPAIWYKRLEKGSFSGRENTQDPMSRCEFFMLLEGVTAKREKLRYRLL